MLPENQNDVPNINLINSDIATSTKLLDPIYDMKPNIEGLDSPTGKEEDTTTKKRFQSTVSSSAVADVSDVYAEQMRALTSDPAYRITPFQDSDAVGIVGADSDYFSTGANLKSQQSYASQFDNVNGDNIDSYYTTNKKIGTTTGNVFKAVEGFGKSIEGFQEQVKEAGMSPLFTAAMGASIPATVLASAASWIGLGLKQEKDKNNFLKEFGEKGFSQELLGKSYPYAGKANKTGQQFLEHILYNSNNPGYALKYNAYGGKKGFQGNHIDALAKFMNDSMDNNIIPESNILNMSANRYNTQGGSNAYMTTTAAQKALEGKGWQVKGRVAISPDGTQYLDGKVWAGKDVSGIIKKKYGFVNTLEPDVVKKDTSVIKSKTEPVITQQSILEGLRKEKIDKQKAQASEKKDYEKPSPQGGGGQDASTWQPTPSVTPQATPSYEYDASGRKGYSFGLQAGGPVPIGNPMGQQQEQQPIQDAGNLELVQEQGKDQSGVADDVKRQLNEGDFVINAPAREMAGHGDIEKMVMKAITELQRKGVKLDFGQKAEDPNSIVQALVSNKELIIPKIIAEQIGYDRLEKINNRGKQRVDEIEKEKAQQEKGFVQLNPQGQSPQPVQMGGVVTLEENKNQPIAVPRESFATMSSVGKKLLSPLSPEQADKELTELSKPSQSFEGFVKPIKMNEGGKLEFTDEEFDALIMRESSGDPKSKGDIKTGDTAVGLTQIRGLALEDVNKELGTNYSKDDLLNDPEISKLVGKTYLNQQLKRFGDKKLALAAYNYGPTNVEKLTQGSMLNYHKLPSEVKSYVSFILDKTIPEIKPKPIIPTIKPKPQQTGMMAVN